MDNIVKVAIIHSLKNFFHIIRCHSEKLCKVFILSKSSPPSQNLIQKNFFGKLKKLKKTQLLNNNFSHPELTHKDE